MPTRHIAVMTSLGVKIACGLLLIGLAARWLDASRFIFFVQFSFLLAVANLVATGGVIHGVVRTVAAGDSAARGTILGTALRLSSAIGAVVVAAALLLGGSVADLLVGDREWGWLVAVLAPLAVIAGQGQIICAYLTGAGHAVANMVIQTAALAFATLAALGSLWLGDAALATLVFAGGLATQAPIALFWLRRTGHYHDGMLWHQDRSQRSELLRYGGAFVLTASAMPLALFLLRDDYRATFGAVALAGWLAANRLSDVTTQLLGVYMGQIYLPEQAAAQSTDDGRLRLSLYARHLLIAGGLMASGVGLFLLIPTFWVRVGLGPAMLPAVAIISLYLVGDVLRSWPSINQHSLLAGGRTGLYAVHEVAATAIFVAFTLWCKALFATMAPAAAYIAANAVVGAGGFALLLRLHRTSRSDGSAIS